MPVTVTPRAVEVLRRSLSAFTDPLPGVRVWLTRNGDTQIGFADEPAEGDEVALVNGVRVFVAPGLADAVLDVADEHDRIIVRRA